MSERPSKSYDHLLMQSDEAKKEAASRLTGFLRVLPNEIGEALYKEEARNIIGMSARIGASYKGRNDFKRTLPQGLIGIRQIFEPGRLTTEFQVILKPLEVTIVGVDYDRAEAILEDASKLTFPPLFLADKAELGDMEEEMKRALADIFSRSGN